MNKMDLNFCLDVPIWITAPVWRGLVKRSEVQNQTAFLRILTNNNSPRRAPRKSEQSRKLLCQDCNREIWGTKADDLIPLFVLFIWQLPGYYKQLKSTKHTKNLLDSDRLDITVLVTLCVLFKRFCRRKTTASRISLLNQNIYYLCPSIGLSLEFIQ